MADALDFDIAYGTMDTPEAEARVKRLYEQLQGIERDWTIINPAPAFKITKDKNGIVHVKFDDRMMRYMLMKFSELEDLRLQTITPDNPPDWFMALMGNEPYEHLLPVNGAVILPKDN